MTKIKYDLKPFFTSKQKFNCKGIVLKNKTKKYITKDLRIKNRLICKYKLDLENLIESYNLYKDKDNIDCIIEFLKQCNLKDDDIINLRLNKKLEKQI